MITSDVFNNYLTKIMVYDHNLNTGTIDPYMANGLVFKGLKNINKIGLAVSASITVFEKAVKANCDGLIVHHAFNLPIGIKYDQLFQQRYSYLVNNNLNLWGYHFLLDSHPTIGHNSQIINKIGGKIDKPYFIKGNPWCYFGKLENISLNNIINVLKPDLSPNMTLYDFGPKNIKKVVAASGRGTPIPSDIQYLVDNQVDLFITGEDSEWIREIFREVKINYLAGGHYHTERFGLLALKNQIDQELDISTELIELINNV